MRARWLPTFFLTVLALAACSTSAPGVVDQPDATPADAGHTLRPLPDDVLARKGMSYSGFRTGENPYAKTYPTEDEIKEDMQLLLRGGWSFIRLFDCTRQSELVLKVIRDNAFDIKVQLGVWIGGAKDGFDPVNQVEIDRCVALDATYSDIIASVSVGNETLDDWSSVRVPAPELVEYIEEVRAKVAHPITTDDLYLPFMFGQNGTTSYANVVDVAKAVDFLSIHVYAYIDAPWSWDWKQLGVPEGHDRAVAMMNAAMVYTKACVHNVRAALAAHGLERTIIVGEAGWKSTNTRTADKDANFRAHPVNQKIFYDAFTSWVYGADKNADSPRTAFYFQPFDEPWKTEDDAWGLFNVDRKAKYVMWSEFPDLKPADAPEYDETDAIYYIAQPPPVDGGDASTSDAGSDASSDGGDVEIVDAGDETTQADVVPGSAR
jgi:exo-beta-1,3-glucanase (GH17 family)